MSLALVPLLYFAPGVRGGRVLVVTDRTGHDAGLLDVDLSFAKPGAAVSTKRVDAVVVDVADRDPFEIARGLADAPPTLVLLDWRRSFARSLVDASRTVRGGPSPAPDGYATRWEFLLEPGLAEPRHLVRPGFRSEIPAEYGSALRRGLKRAGLFYLQPRHRAFILARTDAREPVLAALDEALAARVDRAAVRGVYVSPTGAMIVRVEHGGRRYYLRFPFTDAALERVRASHGMETLLRELGATTGPDPVHLVAAGGCPFQLESAVRGRPLEGVTAHDAADPVAAAVDALLDLHLARGERTVLDDARFGEIFDERFARIAAATTASPALEEVRRRLHDGLRGKTVRRAVSHGDFKLGNCLFEDGRVSGIVDWDVGSPHDLGLVDVANLHGKVAQDASGLSYGEIAADPARWSFVFGEGFRRYFERSGTTPVEPATMLLLWWVDRVSRHQRFAGPDAPWMRRHALPLLDRLGSDAVVAR